jgi:molecular chaperone DnaK
MPQVEVTFDIDANGILNVSAKDLGTGKTQKIVITASSGLSKDEVEKMRRDAEAHADEDKARREEVELRNEADNTVYRSEKFLKDNGDKIGAAKSETESAIAAVKDALKGSDSAVIRAALDKLNQAVQTAGASVYPQGQAPGAAPGGAPGPETADGKKPEDGTVIDAEIVDDKKKS